MITERDGDLYVLKLTRAEVAELQLVLASTTDFDDAFPNIDSIGRGIHVNFPDVALVQRQAWAENGSALFDITSLAAAAAVLRERTA
jgi:hypothetical protein